VTTDTGGASSGSNEPRLAGRVRGIEPSGIRRIFELMSTMKNPINLSIGQPHYDPPDELVEAACRAIREAKSRTRMGSARLNITCRSTTLKSLRLVVTASSAS
jgi:hypothetical protein